MAVIWETVLDGKTITIKQNVRFQERMHVEKFRLDQIQNGRLSAIIKQNVIFRGRMHPENSNSKWPTFDIIYLDRPDIR